MYGFIGCYEHNNDSALSTDTYFRKDSQQIRFITSEINTKNLHVLRKTVDKFIEDKVFIENEEYVIVFEGTLYNSKDLKEKYDVESNSELLTCLYDRFGPQMVEQLNGAFSFIVYSKIEDKLYCFTSHLAFHPIYYAMRDGKFYFSTDIIWLYGALCQNGYKLEGDIDGLYSLISYGFMLGEKTIVKDLFLLESGCYISVNEQGIIKTQYWSLNNVKKIDEDYDYLLEKAEKYFCEAVDRLFEKDKEYGYSHLCTLSGGLDCKAVTMVAKERGYKDILAITMSESGFADETIASEVAHKIGIKHIQFDLDNGFPYLDIDKAVLSNGGGAFYAGQSGINWMLDTIDTSEFGYLHTGEIGDVIFGGTGAEIDKEDWNLSDVAFSKKLTSRISTDFQDYIKTKYKTGKECFIVCRGANGDSNSWIGSNAYTESCSPFIDKDFMTFLLSVPTEYLLNSRFYIDWIKKYHPQIAKFEWTGTSTRPDASDIYKKLIRFKRRVIAKISKKPFSMTPYDIWYKENIDLRRTFDLIYNDGIDRIHNEELVNDCRYLYTKGNGTEKIMVVSLLRSIVLFNIEI